MNELEKLLGTKLPSDYVSFLEYIKLNFTNGLVTESVFIYLEEDDLIERYKTFEMGEYLPTYLGIGNDSGGSEIIISLAEKKSKIYFTDHGAYFENCLQIIAQNFDDFIDSGFSIETIAYKIPRILTEKDIAENNLQKELSRLFAELQTAKLKRETNEITLKEYLLTKNTIEKTINDLQNNNKKNGR